MEICISADKNLPGELRKNFFVNFYEKYTFLLNLLFMWIHIYTKIYWKHPNIYIKINTFISSLLPTVLKANYYTHNSLIRWGICVPVKFHEKVTERDKK